MNYYVFGSPILLFVPRLVINNFDIWHSIRCEVVGNLHEEMQIFAEPKIEKFLFVVRSSIKYVFAEIISFTSISKVRKSILVYSRIINTRCVCVNVGLLWHRKIKYKMNPIMHVVVSIHERRTVQPNRTELQKESQMARRLVSTK